MKNHFYSTLSCQQNKNYVLKASLVFIFRKIIKKSGKDPPQFMETEIKLSFKSSSNSNFNIISRVLLRITKNMRAQSAQSIQYLISLLDNSFS
jgi:hypothetical protein